MCAVDLWFRGWNRNGHPQPLICLTQQTFFPVIIKISKSRKHQRLKKLSNFMLFMFRFYKNIFQKILKSIKSKPLFWSIPNQCRIKVVETLFMCIKFLNRSKNNQNTIKLRQVYRFSPRSWLVIKYFCLLYLCAFNTLAQVVYNFPSIRK